MDWNDGYCRGVVADPPQETHARCHRGDLMTQLFSSLADYLYDMRPIKFDAWVALGFVAQAFFTRRFVVQWIASERTRKSVIPVAFWFITATGGLTVVS